MKKTILSFFLSFFLFLSLGLGQSSTQTQFRGVFQWRNVTAWPDTAEAHYHVEFGNFNDQGGEYLATGVDSTCVAWDNLGGRWRVVRVDSATVASAWVLVKSLNASWGVPFGVGFVSKETEGGAGLSLTAPDNSTGISPQLQARIEGHNMILIDNLFEDVVLNMVDTFYMAADTGDVQQLLATDTIKINGGYGVVTGLSGENRTVIWADTLELSTVYHSEHYADSLFLLDLDQDSTNEIQYVDSLTLLGTTLGVSLSSDGIPAVTVNLAPILSGYTTGSGAAGQVTYWSGATSITGENSLFWDAANDRLGIGTASPSYALDINSTGGMRLPVGTTAQRPTNAAGGVRYNSSLGYSETANGSAWLQSDFPAGTNQQTIRHNGTSWVSSNVYSNGSFLGIGAQLFTWPITISRVGVAQSQVLGIQIAGTEDGYIVWSSGSTSSYFMGKNTSGYWVMLEGNSTGTGIAYNRESNSFNVNDVFETKGTLTATWRAPSSGTQNNVLYLEGSSTSNVLTFVNSGHLGINTLTPARTLHVEGEARISDLTTDTPTRIIGADAGGDLAAVSEGYGTNITGGALEIDTTEIATQSDLAAISPTTLYTGDGTIAEDRTVTIGSDKTLTISGTTTDLPGYSYTEKKGYSSDWDTWGYYRLIYDDDYYTNFIQGILNYDSSVFVRISAGDWAGDYFASLYMNESGQLALSGIDDSGASAGMNFADNTTLGGYGARLAGGAGIEFDTETGGKFVYQINNSTKWTLDGTGVGIGDSSPETSLDVAGMAKVRQLVGQDGEPTAGTNANMGTGRSITLNTSQSSGLAGRFSITSGTGLTVGEWFTFTFPYSFSEAPAVQLFPEDIDGASLMPYIWVQPTTTGCSFQVNATGASWESKTFEFNYVIIGGK